MTALGIRGLVTPEWFTVEIVEMRQCRSRLFSILEAQEAVLSTEEQSYLADYRVLILDAALALTEAISLCEAAMRHDARIVADHAVNRARLLVEQVDALESDTAHKISLLACRRVGL